MPEGPAVPRVTLADVEAARARLAGAVARTPLVPFRGDARAEVHLKLENLHPIGCFKLRGAGNVLLGADPAELTRGVVTASAGNMAQGVAWFARRLGVSCRVVVPDHAPRAKLDAARALGAEVFPVPFERWWRVLEERGHPDVPGFFVHPVSDPAVIAGNGTIGLEILEDLPDVDTIVVPFGGGGLVSGIATAVRALRPEVRILAAEVETAAPLAASLAAGAPTEVPYRPSFVDGIGAGGVLAEMWPLVSELVDGSLVVSLGEVAEALRLIALRNGVVAEGAGAAATAAARAGAAGGGRVVCVVSGGNLDASKLAPIIAGELP
jgi:threonine dehydratase